MNIHTQAAGALLSDVLRTNPLPLPFEDALSTPKSSALSTDTPNNLKPESPPAVTRTWELGRTKLYFTAGVLEHLESLRSFTVSRR